MVQGTYTLPFEILVDCLLTRYTEHAYKCICAIVQFQWNRRQYGYAAPGNRTLFKANDDFWCDFVDAADENDNNDKMMANTPFLMSWFIQKQCQSRQLKHQTDESGPPERRPRRSSPLKIFCDTAFLRTLSGSWAFAWCGLSVMEARVDTSTPQTDKQTSWQAGRQAGR